jgi:hydroxymethylpyrimidine/phosphomethylpyrimidine kinase
MNMRVKYIKARAAVLVIAGSDSSGGAGLARDLRVLAEFGIPAVCALTAVTAQSHEQVRRIHHIPPRLVSEQIITAFQAHEIGAIKIGMLGTRATVEAVVASLPSRDTVPIVLDPVLAATSGGVLLDDSGRKAMSEQLLGRIMLVTPNIPEAAMLLHASPATNEAAMMIQARQLQRLGPRAVLLKGGHARGAEAVDVLIDGEDPPLRLASPRSSTNLRGTGCALASAITAMLATGVSLAEACHLAKRYVWNEMRQCARRDGQGRQGE